MADFINTIDLLGDELAANMFINRSMTEFNDDVLTTIGQGAFMNCANLTSISLPNVTAVMYRAFQYCTTLINVTLPKLTITDGSAFLGCEALTNVTLPNVITLKGSDFNNCRALGSVYIPNVATIGSSAFSNCTSLTSVTLPATPPTIQSSTFNGINSACVFHIPAGSLSAYQSATNWSTLTGTYTFTEDA